LVDRYYVAIEGPIGVGKTTLARLIHEALQADLLLEVFEENPFLSDFYADRAAYAFQTQIFFVLSRYRQQHQVIARVLKQTSLVSDYTFAKDQLFARLNLSADELAVYDNLHAVLAQRIPLPDLVVHLRADLDVLMERIAIRDRSYERSMDRRYMQDLVDAYDRFFNAFTQTPVLIVDTNHLNIVRSQQDLDHVIERIRSALGTGTHQRPLLDLESLSGEGGQAIIEGRRRRLRDLQQWHQIADRETGIEADLYQDFIGLQATLGALAGELGHVWKTQAKLTTQFGNRQEAQSQALVLRAQALKGQLASSLDNLLRLANDLGISLEEAYLERFRASGGQIDTGGAQ